MSEQTDDKPYGTSYLDYTRDKLQIAYGDTEFDYEMWRAVREARNAEMAAAQSEASASVLGRGVFGVREESAQGTPAAQNSEGPPQEGEAPAETQRAQTKEGAQTYDEADAALDYGAGIRADSD